MNTGIRGGLHYESYWHYKTKTCFQEQEGFCIGEEAGARRMILGQIKLEDLEQERLEVRKSVEKKSTTKKQVEKKSVSAAKAADTKAEVKAAEAVAEEPKEEVKAAEAAATEEPKTEEPAAAKQEEKAEEPKAKTTRTRASKKEDTKDAAKTTAKKAEITEEPKTRTKSAAKAAVEKIVLQMGGREDVVMNSLIDRVKAAYVAEGHKADSIKNVEVYIKVDENMAYYVIDGYASGISLY